MSEFDSFQTLLDDVVSSKERRQKEARELIPFGISFLDDAFKGILPSDLILIGGRSGGGKTELVVHLASEAVLRGKRVYYFALEAEAHEIGDRILYKKICQLYFADKFKERTNVSYDEWRSGFLPELDKYEERAKQELIAFNNFRVRYASESYGIGDFQRDLISAKDDADLICLDHLHYLELDTEESNQAYKAAVKRIRHLALEYRIPILLIAHIRKMDKRVAGLVPEQEDFHGSSDIVKICTKAITIASASEHFRTLDSHLWPTFIKAVKHRRNGSKTFSIGAINYDISKNVYQPDYVLGVQVRRGNEIKFEPYAFDQIPKWAVNHKKTQVLP